MHTEYTLLMSMALDDEAGAADLARLHMHLAECAECRATWASWQELDRRMLAAPLIASPDGLAEQVAARLEAQELRRRRVRWIGSGLALSWLGLVVLAVLSGAGMVAWLTANLAQVGLWVSNAAQVLTAVNGLLRGVVATANSVGAPVLAAMVGSLACLTCALGMVWLWFVAQNGRVSSARAQTR